MKNVYLGAALLAAVLGTASAALTTYLLAPPSVSGAQGDGEQGLSREAELDELVAARFQSLRDANDALRKRIELLEMQPAPAARTPLGPGLAVDLGAEQGEPSKLAKGPQAFKGTDGNLGLDGPFDPEFELEVQRVIETMREEERQEQQRKKQAQRERKQDAQLEWMTERLGLTQYQADEVRAAWTAREESYAELEALWEAGVDVETMAVAKQSTHDEYQAQMEMILTPEQLELLAEDTGK